MVGLIMQTIGLLLVLLPIRDGVLKGKVDGVTSGVAARLRHATTITKYRWYKITVDLSKRNGVAIFWRIIYFNQ